MNSSTNTSTGSARLRVPGKILVLGEYLALASGQALVWSFPPYFELSETGSSVNKLPFHPQSPAGKLAAELSKHMTLPSFHFVDPFDGHGGFGGSTAEFSLLFQWALAKQNKKATAWEVWEKYQSFFAETLLRPSGVDLLVQSMNQANESLVSVDIPMRELQSFLPPSEAKWVVFSAAHQAERKTKTHEHLQEIQQMGFPDAFAPLIGDLAKTFAKAVNALKGKNTPEFAKSIQAYAEILSSAGFEDKDAKEDRLAFQKAPGVLAVKGCGALLSDSVLVLVEGNVEPVLTLGNERGLQVVCS